MTITFYRTPLCNELRAACDKCYTLWAHWEDEDDFDHECLTDKKGNQPS